MSDDKLVVYDHQTGESLLLDKTTNTVTKIIDTQAEGRLALKNADGKYRTEVKLECKRLYFGHVPTKEISRRTGVPEYALNNWIYGRDKTSTDFKCWRLAKRRFMEESREQNLATYVSIEKSALTKIHDYLLDPKQGIANTRQFKEFAEGIAKLLYVPGNNANPSTKEPSQKTQININTQVVNPLTPEEARDILISDPIRVTNLEPKE